MIWQMFVVKLQELLEEKQISLYRMQKDTGIAYTTLLKLKNKKSQYIDLEVLTKVCKYLNCTPNDLLALEE